MWIINNSLDVIRALEEKQLSPNHVSTWDFSTLYTSLPHAPLKKQLHDPLERVFNTKGLPRASLLPIIFAPSGRMIERQRGTRTSPVEGFVSLLTFLSTTSTFVLEALFSGRLLVYQWAPTVHLYYTCQLFLRYKREIFILGVLEFLKTTPSFPKIPEEFRSLPKKSEVFRRRPKSAEDCQRRARSQCFSLQKSEIARKLLPFIHFTHGFRSLHGSELTYFWKLCPVGRQQLTFFNQA